MSCNFACRGQYMNCFNLIVNQKLMRYIKIYVFCVLSFFFCCCVSLICQIITVFVLIPFLIYRPFCTMHFYLWTTIDITIRLQSILFMCLQFTCMYKSRNENNKNTSFLLGRWKRIPNMYGTYNKYINITSRIYCGRTTRSLIRRN